MPGRPGEPETTATFPLERTTGVLAFRERGPAPCRGAQARAGNSCAFRTRSLHRTHARGPRAREAWRCDPHRDARRDLARLAIAFPAQVPTGLAGRGR